MSAQPTDQIRRGFEFDAPEAVARSRANARFISCPVCRADAERYLFHERGARFVQCRSCDTVFVNPPARELRDYFDVHAAGITTFEDRDHVRRGLNDVLHYAADVHRAHRGSPPARVVLAGLMPDDLSTPDDLSIASSAHIDAVRLTHDETLRLVHEADVSAIVAAIGDDVDLVVLNHLLEACPRAADVVAALASRLPSRALLVVVYSNTASLPGRLLRRHWRRFFHWRTVYFNSENLRGMVEREGLRLVRQSGLNTSYTVSRALDLVVPGTKAASLARCAGLSAATLRAPTGTHVSIFERGGEPGSASCCRSSCRCSTRRLTCGVCSTSCWPGCSSSRTRSSSSRATAPTAPARSCRATKGAPGSESSTRTARAAKAPPFAAA